MRQRIHPISDCLPRETECERERESESEWFIEKGCGPMSVAVTNTVKQLQVNVRLTGTTSVQTKLYCVHQKPCVEKQRVGVGDTYFQKQTTLTI